MRARVTERREAHLSRERQALAGELLEAGLIDHEFIEAQLGREFESDAAAAAAWAATAPRLHYAPHPLWEPAWQQESARSAKKGAPASAAPWQPAGLQEPASIVAMGRAVAGLEPRSLLEPAHDGGVGTGQRVTWGQVRHDALERARIFAGQDARSTRRNVRYWEEPPAHYSRDDRLVSVIMPVRNRARLIGRAIASVRAQTHTHWELIVVDDGSTDDTAEVVTSIAALDPRVVLLHQEQGGVSAARNAGIAVARGVGVAFLDSDNEWRPHHLTACLAHWDDPDDVAVYSVVAVQTSDGAVEYSAHSADRASLLEGRNPIDLNALLVGRDALRAIGGFDETLRRWVDYDLVLRLSLRLEFRLVPVVGVHYDHRDDAHDRITTRESPLWRRVVLHRALVDSSALAASAAGRSEGIAVVIRNRNEWSATLTSLLHCVGLPEVAAVIVIDAASTRDNSAILGAVALFDDRITVHRTAGDHGWTLSVILGAQLAHQRWVVGVRPGATPSSEELAEARGRASHGLVRDPDAPTGTLVAASVTDLAGISAIDLLEDPLEG